VAREINLHGFSGAPIRGQSRKLAHNQRLDERSRRFFVVRIRADVADLRIREANDLPGVTGIGENFLIAREAGIENDFAAASRARARGSALEKPPVLKREDRRPCCGFGQLVLPQIISPNCPKAGLCRSDPSANTRRRPCRK
jgi:hypothetical protein